MTPSDSIREKFDVLKVCVIIPTYNNSLTLGKVIEEVGGFSKNIIVVNDGSTDNTINIVKAFPFVQLVSYGKNRGKGWALRQAFAFAFEKGYRYGITIDSDGQHFAKDLPTFINKLEQEPNAIIIGARNMDQASVPGGSNFGNRISTYWFKVETGINIPDTQSGYRLYPLEPINKIKFLTVKYEFEIEVMVKCAWKGVNVISVPVSVYYPPKGERVSHFRPYKDFIRIGILNVVLVLISFLYIKPRDFFRGLFIKKKESERLIKTQLSNPEFSARQKAISIGFGVFMGIVPIWGFQLVAAIFLAIFFKLNKILVIIAANISLPPMIPFIIYGSYKMGAIWMGDDAIQLDFNRSISLASIKNNLQQYIFGSITLAIIAGLIFGALTFVLLKLYDKKSVPAKQVI